jgi:hypothetical protein
MKPELKTTRGDVIYLTDRAAPTRYETPRASSSALSAKRAARELLTVSREPRGTQGIGDELHDRKESLSCVISSRNLQRRLNARLTASTPYK